VANPIPVNWPLIANFAARHEGNLPYEINKKYTTGALSSHERLRMQARQGAAIK
jgi:hypothetical protein